MSRIQQLQAELPLMLSRLDRLQSHPARPHERPIVEVGILALRDRIRRMGRQLERFGD